MISVKVKDKDSHMYMYLVSHECGSRSKTKRGAYLVRHEGGHAPSDLMVPLGLLRRRAQQDEQESGGDRHLGQVAERHGVLEADESDDRPREKIHFTDEYVGRLCTGWNLAHETVSRLQGIK